MFEAIVLAHATRGATERANQTIEDLLCTYCNNYLEVWFRCLHLIEFAFNDAVNTATGMSPFYLILGMHLTTLLTTTLHLASNMPTAHSYLQQLVQGF